MEVPISPKIAVSASAPTQPSARAQWLRAARDNLLANREKRRERLIWREPAIKAGSSRYEAEFQLGVQKPSVTIREGMFVSAVPLEPWESDPSRAPKRSAENPDVLSQVVSARVNRRAPLGQLVHRRGAAAPLFVSAIGIASFRGLPGDSVDFSDIANSGKSSWAKLIGDGDRAEVARRHVVDGVKRLRSVGVVRLATAISSSPGFSGWGLLQEDGSEAEFVVPQVGLSVPADFWLKGWAAVLTPPEILTYFMLRHAAETWPAAHASQGVGIPPTAREQRYGVTKSTYATLNELEEFGLVKRTSERQPGSVDEAKPREVDRFQVQNGGLKRNAFSTVTEVLGQKQTPLRLAHYDSDLQMLQHFRASVAAAAGVTEPSSAPSPTKPKSAR